MVHGEGLFPFPLLLPTHSCVSLLRLVQIRLGWHDSGTYCADKGEFPGAGGAIASIRFKPEIDHAANAGLASALALLAPIKEKFPEVSYADLFQLASATAVEVSHRLRRCLASWHCRSLASWHCSRSLASWHCSSLASWRLWGQADCHGEERRRFEVEPGSGFLLTLTSMGQEPGGVEGYIQTCSVFVYRGQVAGGPKIPMRYGRIDSGPDDCAPEGYLPGKLLVYSTSY